MDYALYNVFILVSYLRLLLGWWTEDIVIRIGGADLSRSSRILALASRDQEVYCVQGDVDTLKMSQMQEMKTSVQDDRRHDAV